MTVLCGCNSAGPSDTHGKWLGLTPGAWVPPYTLSRKLLWIQSPGAQKATKAQRKGGKGMLVKEARRARRAKRARGAGPAKPVLPPMDMALIEVELVL